MHGRGIPRPIMQSPEPSPVASPSAPTATAHAINSRPAGVSRISPSVKGARAVHRGLSVATRPDRNIARIPRAHRLMQSGFEDLPNPTHRYSLSSSTNTPSACHSLHSSANEPKSRRTEPAPTGDSTEGRWTEPAPTGDSTEDSLDRAGSYSCFRDKLRPYSVVRRQLLLAPRRAILELSASSQTIPRCPFPRVRKPADFKMVTGDDQRASGRCREIPRIKPLWTRGSPCACSTRTDSVRT